MTAYENAVSLKSGEESEKPEEFSRGQEDEDALSIKMIKSEEEEKEEVDVSRRKWKDRTWAGRKESGRLRLLKAGPTCNQSLCLYTRNNNPHLNQFSSYCTQLFSNYLKRSV